MEFLESFSSLFPKSPSSEDRSFLQLVYCFAWWSYIFIIDAVIYRLKENSLVVNRTKEFLIMIPGPSFSG